MVILSRRKIFLIILAVCLAVSFLYSCRKNSPETHRLEGKTMGTTWSVLSGGLPKGLALSSLKPLLQQRLDRINQLMSTYDPVSEISRFNNSRTNSWFPVSPETAAVVELAQEISRLSGGAFDITVGPLVDLWGFGPRPQSGHPPADSEIEAARSMVGYRRLQVRRSPAALRKEIPGLRIDLSAIAKGYAVDQLAEILIAHGVFDMVVEIGGEMRIRGRHPDGKGWRIAVEKPLPGKRAVEKIFSFADTGMATSGNYRNFFIENGQTYAHTIDPSTGRPVRHKLASVTVLDPSCARADALATALAVMGDELAVEFCRREKIAAYLLIHKGKGTTSVMTDHFRAFIDKVVP